MQKINETTRVFPRTLDQAFRENYYDIERQRNWEWLEGHADSVANQVEFWTYIALAFAAGFMVHLLWGAA